MAQPANQYVIASFGLRSSLNDHTLESQYMKPCLFLVVEHGDTCRHSDMLDAKR